MVEVLTAGAIAGPWSPPAGLCSGEEGSGEEGSDAGLPDGGEGLVDGAAVLPDGATEVGLPPDPLGLVGPGTPVRLGTGAVAPPPDGPVVLAAGSSTAGAASTAVALAAPARTTMAVATVSPAARPGTARHRRRRAGLPEVSRLPQNRVRPGGAGRSATPSRALGVPLRLRSRESRPPTSSTVPSAP